jgi:hypothetical protein
LNSIASYQNNVNLTLWDTKKGVSEGFLYRDSAAIEKPFNDVQKEGFFTYPDHNAQTLGDSPGSLGTITKSCKQDIEDKRLRIEKRQKKQEVARNLVGGRLETCGRVPVPVTYNGDIIHIPDGERSIHILKNDESFIFGGLMRCGSVWSCPTCASIITEYRRNELIEAHASAIAQGLFISMLTLTVPHYAKDRLEDVLSGIQKALRTMKNRKPFKKLAEEIELVGNIRTLEVTYGENGWHPHFHILLFTKKLLSDDGLKTLKEVLLSQWQAACVSSGLPCPNVHGVDLVDGAWAAAYVTKWGIEEEMTKGSLKNGKKAGHVSPFALLDIYAEGDENAGKRFQEYARVFKGRRQLVWSKGLRELLEVGKQRSDEGVIEEVEKKSEVFMKISYDDFKRILAHNKQAECLFMCNFGVAAVNAWLADLRRQDCSFHFPPIT